MQYYVQRWNVSCARGGELVVRCPSDCALIFKQMVDQKRISASYGIDLLGA